MKKKLLAGGIVAFVLLLAALAIVAVRLQPVAREYALKAIRERYQSDVELGDLKVSLIPWIRATGENLVLRKNGRRDIPPLARVRKFTLSSSFFSLLRQPPHVGSLTLEDLEITVPPRGRGRDQGDNKETPKASFVLDRVIADGARLRILPKTQGKEPLFFDIQKLTLRSAGVGERMNFHAELVNPKPKGQINTDGSFGPWVADEPGDSTIEGKYTFRNADLGVFKGIRGVLSSDGAYHGQLDTIEVKGTCEVPDFALHLAGNPMPLHTDFDATVDGVDGDTVLHPVRARLGKSNFEVSGAIERRALENKKTIALETKSGAGARLEDFLHLAMKGNQAAMTGAIRFQSTVKIPPGENDVIDRLELDGTYGLGRVHFTSPDVATRIADLSNRAQGEPESEKDDVPAASSGHFRLREGVMTLPDLKFSIPGAAISLAGTYRMRGSELNFAGTARLEATVSQMTTGVKKILLKPIDPLFKRDGAGAVVPVKIGGAAGQPSFSLDIGRALRRK